MKYGVVLGKHLDISRAELTAYGISIEKNYQNIAIFSLENEETDFLNTLAGIIKRGRIIPTSLIDPSDLIGVNEKGLGAYLKKKGLCRRFKDYDASHSDEEVKKNGVEFISVDEDYDNVLQVIGYQDIERYSCIDFDKPINSMQIGMMPAKLTQILVNIGVGEASKLRTSEDGATHSDNTDEHTYTIYDPFMGLGTTYMVANSLGYNCIGSDVNITPAKQNLPRWTKQKYYHDHPITLFNHDATQSLSKPFLKYVDCIVTEGRLGHIVTSKTKPIEIAEYSQEIQKLYTARINNMKPIRKHMVIVCAIPHHINGENKHITEILQHCEKKGITVKTIPQVYNRPGQKVGRKIVILKR